MYVLGTSYNYHAQGTVVVATLHWNARDTQFVGKIMTLTETTVYRSFIRWPSKEQVGSIDIWNLNKLILQPQRDLPASLVAQDIALFRQLFSLQEAILEMREQSELSSCSSDESSPCSTLSSSSSLTNLGALSKHSSSFVRHHVSYPPIARNRSYRIKSSAPQHGCQDSYDSGIHTSDHEIFV
ncbi:Uncharacterized protein GBIM_17559 [Gryllus bimaculatus]|nr:Uncharacterized protein GBIM_17559 [Gryllus bimaculatus]